MRTDINYNEINDIRQDFNNKFIRKLKAGKKGKINAPCLHGC